MNTLQKQKFIKEKGFDKYKYNASMYRSLQIHYINSVTGECWYFSGEEKFPVQTTIGLYKCIQDIEKEIIIKESKFKRWLKKFNFSFLVPGIIKK